MAARSGAVEFTLRELHGVIQVAMGWEGIHLDALEDLDIMVEVLQQVALKDGSEPLAPDQETRWRLQDAPGAGQGSRGSAGSAVFAAGSQRQSSR